MALQNGLKDIYKHVHEQKLVLHACTCAHSRMYSANPQLYTHLALSDCGNSLFSFIAVFLDSDRLKMNPVPLMGSGGTRALLLSLAFYPSIFLATAAVPTSVQPFSPSFTIFFHLFPSFSLIPASLPTRAHTITPPPYELSGRGGGEAEKRRGGEAERRRARPSGSWCFFVFF